MMKFKIRIKLLGIDLEIEDSNEKEEIFTFLNQFFDFVKQKQDIMESFIHSNSVDKENKRKSVKNFSKEQEAAAESLLIADSSDYMEKMKILASNILNFTIEGDVIYKIDLNSLTNTERIFIVCLEKALMFEEKIGKDDLLNAEYISDKLGLDIQQVRARLSDLVKENKLNRVGRGEYKINIYSASNYLEIILINRNHE